MDSIFYEKILYRIIRGRLRYRRGDLVLFIYEPTSDIMEESHEIYDDSYRHAYFNGVYVKDELPEVLVKHELWSPFDDREADTIDKQIEELKISAYKNFFSSKALSSIKQNLRFLEKRLFKFRSKKNCLDYVSCEGVAEMCRLNWILSKTTKCVDESDCDWGTVNLSDILSYYTSNIITQDQYRYIARNDPWRGMWNASKKSGNIFDRSCSQYTKDQLMLCNYSGMYDNVYESHESPKEKIIQDDDCLDGWFIIQRREYEKSQTEKEVDKIISNPKISNSQEVYVMARDQDNAQEIYDLNDPLSRSRIRSRQEQIRSADSQIKNTELHDVKQTIYMQSVQEQIQASKSGGR